MKIVEAEDRGVIVIRIEGDMVGGPAARQLTERLREHISDEKRNFLVDMAGISWMNSSGLGTLMGGLSTVRNAGCSLKLLHVNEKILNLLRITRLSSLFETFEDEEEAIASFNT